ncbi:MAG: glycine zipper family protein [Actinomycetota bacterium]|nr:glycine zipper family protein [Actinomycetota bacterium]
MDRGMQQRLRRAEQRELARADARTTVDSAGRASPVLVSASRYQDAQRTVDLLADKGFAVQRLSIVAEGLRFVENVTGRATYWTAAWQGVLSGGFIGAILGIFFGAFSWVDPLVSSLALAAYGLLLGGVAGAVVGLIAHSLTGGSRDFSSTGRMEASRYDVTCDAEVIDEARSLLAEERARHA